MGFENCIVGDWFLSIFGVLYVIIHNFEVIKMDLKRRGAYSTAYISYWPLSSVFYVNSTLIFFSRTNHFLHIALAENEGKISFCVWIYPPPPSQNNSNLSRQSRI